MVPSWGTFCKMSYMPWARGALGVLFISVSAPVFGQITVTNNSPLPYSSVGANYSVQLTATPAGLAYQWSISAGALPAGLKLTAQTGVISGMPKAGGTSTFTVSASNSQFPQPGTKQLSIGILQISTPSPLPGATLGTFYSITFNESDGPPSPGLYFWQANQPPPPPGLTLASNGVLSGTPTSTGGFNFQVLVVDDKDGIQATKNFAMTVAGAVSITTPSPLPNGDANSPYQATLNANGGTPPYHWSVPNGLPLGLNLDPNAGIINGTPLTAGTTIITVQVTDRANSGAAARLSLTINQALKITNASPLPSGTVATAYSQAIA